MATKHKTSSTVAAATSLALSLLLFTTHSEACGCKCCPCPNSPSPRPPSPTPGGGGDGKCPIDAVKLGVCANVLGGLVNLELGAPPKKPCCELVRGLADLEAALCLCSVLRANVLGISLNVPVHLSLLVNICGKKVPDGFKCP